MKKLDDEGTEEHNAMMMIKTPMTLMMSLTQILILIPMRMKMMILLILKTVWYKKNLKMRNRTRSPMKEAR